MTHHRSILGLLVATLLTAGAGAALNLNADVLEGGSSCEETHEEHGYRYENGSYWDYFGSNYSAAEERHARGSRHCESRDTLAGASADSHGQNLAEGEVGSRGESSYHYEQDYSYKEERTVRSETVCHTYEFWGPDPVCWEMRSFDSRGSQSYADRSREATTDWQGARAGTFLTGEGSLDLSDCRSASRSDAAGASAWGVGTEDEPSYQTGASETRRDCFKGVRVDRQGSSTGTALDGVTLSGHAGEFRSESETCVLEREGWTCERRTEESWGGSIVLGVPGVGTFSTAQRYDPSPEPLVLA